MAFVYSNKLNKIFISGKSGLNSGLAPVLILNLISLFGRIWVLWVSIIKEEQLVSKSGQKSVRKLFVEFSKTKYSTKNQQKVLTNGTDQVKSETLVKKLETGTISIAR